MANGGRMTSGTLVRQLQYGLDKLLYHIDRSYFGEYEKIFTEVSTDKGFYEYSQMAGVGPAGVKNEGDSALVDSINQDFGFHQPIITYAKQIRITKEAIDYNLYENLPELAAKELVKAHKVTDDLNAVYVINSGVTSGINWGDGVNFFSASHPIQAGGTNTNLVAQALSEDAMETAYITINNIVNPDGNLGDYTGKKLVVPTQLMFLAKKIVGTPYQTYSTNNNINVVGGMVEEVVVWKRITSTTTWIVTTDAENGMLSVRDKAGMVTKTYEEDSTEDVIVYGRKRSSFLVGDWRGAVGNIGS